MSAALSVFGIVAFLAVGLFSPSKSTRIAFVLMSILGLALVFTAPASACPQQAAVFAPMQAVYVPQVAPLVVQPQIQYQVAAQVAPVYVQPQVAAFRQAAVVAPVAKIRTRTVVRPLRLGRRAAVVAPVVAPVVVGY